MENLVNRMDSFEKIISSNSMYAVFQPIVSLKSGQVVALEGLSRGPMGGEFDSPLRLIDEAIKRGKLWELEQLFRDNILRSAGEQGYEGKLFINVDPLILQSPEFQTGMTEQLLKQYGFHPHQIVFELTERSSIDHPGTLQKAIEHYRAQGYGVAIDDAGAGYANLLQLARTRPDYVKIDREIISGLDQDRYKRSIVASLVELGRRVGFQLIAEGIETELEAEAVYRLGVVLGQGYYYAKPKPLIDQIMTEIDTELDSWKRRMDFGDRTVLTVGEIVDLFEQVAPSTRCGQVQKMMKEKDLHGVPVIRESKPVGYMNRAVLGQTLATQYGYAYYAKRSIALIADTQFLVMEAETPIETAAEIAMKRNFLRVYDDVIVTRKGIYYGCVSIRSLLDHTTRQVREEAAALNPLTYLPGNRQIHRELEKFFHSSQKYAVIHFDLNRFKVYNDQKGFEEGDRIIRRTAHLLKEVVVYDNDGFLGHIGGDDFIGIIPMLEDCSDLICQSILDRHMNEVLGMEWDQNSEIPGSLTCAGIVTKGSMLEREFFHKTMTMVKHEAKQSGAPTYQFYRFKEEA